MMRLNKFLAHAGIASRRKCDDIILSGLVAVNGKVIDHVGLSIDEDKDVVTYRGEPVHLQEEYIYVLLNKPHGVVATAIDEHQRQTVVDIVSIPERIYPVGRLDYETTGVLLLTNDGNLTNRLLHPSYKMVKIYHIMLDKVIRPIHLHKLRKGIELDGTNTLPCKINELRIVDNQSFLEMELKEGRNRQIRRMFEYFEYEVVELERMSFAKITTGKLKRGEWRYLKKHEVAELKERVA